MPGQGPRTCPVISGCVATAPHWEGPSGVCGYPLVSRYRYASEMPKPNGMRHSLMGRAASKSSDKYREIRLANPLLAKNSHCLPSNCSWEE